MAWAAPVGTAGEGAGRGARRPAGDALVPGGAMRDARRLGWLERERALWFHWVPVLLGAGIALYFALPSEPSATSVLLPLPFVLVAWLALPRGSLAAALAAALVLIAAGLALAKHRTDDVAAPVLEKRLRAAEVRGFVELVEPREGRGERLTIRVRSIDGLDAAATPYRVRVRTIAAAASGLVAGDGVRLKATLAPPSGPALPGGYDFARGAYYQRLGGVGFALSKVEREADTPPPDDMAWRVRIAQARQEIGARIVAALPGQTGAIANALITGERGGISAATNDAFRDSGLYHMLSISGLHMAVMGGSVFYFVRLLLALFPAVALRFPVKKWAAAAAIAASLGYLVISGAAFATVRSAVTIVVMFLAVILDRPAIAMRNVAISALLILVVWPESLTDVGFQMSFAAVVALVAVFESIRARMQHRAEPWTPGPASRLGLFFAGVVGSTLIASIAVAPFAAYYFHKSQQLAVIANVVATPISNLVVMPAALGALILMPFGLEAVALAAMGFGIDMMIRVADWVAAMPGAVSYIPAIPASSFLLMVMGGLWLALWSGRVRLLGLVAVAAGLVLAPTMPRPDILVGRDGHLVAVRGADGRLAAAGAQRGGFELARWLEHDGDGRSARTVAQRSAFACDDAGCTARVAGRLVAHPRHPSAVADDCARADVLVLTSARPRACRRPGAVIDFFDARGRGTHAIYLDRATAGGGEAGRGIRIVTVADDRGDRPWSRLPVWARDRGEPGSRPRPRDGEGEAVAARTWRGVRPGDRLVAFAAPRAMIEALASATPSDGAASEELLDPRGFDEWW